MNDLAIQVLAFIKAHPEWAICVIGVTAFGESFAFLSLLFPGTAILIASGTLVSEGILSPFPTVAAGIVGAVRLGVILARQEIWNLSPRGMALPNTS